MARVCVSDSLVLCPCSDIVVEAKPQVRGFAVVVLCACGVDVSDFLSDGMQVK
jgi:hypothetical protein